MVGYRLRMDLRIGINIEEHLFYSSQHQIHTGRVFRSGTVSVALPVVEQEPINGFRLICFNQLQPGGPLRPTAAGNAETLGIRIAINADPHAVSDFLKAFGPMVKISAFSLNPFSLRTILPWDSSLLSPLRERNLNRISKATQTPSIIKAVESISLFPFQFTFVT